MTITGYTGIESSITIPASIDGHYVKTIGTSAFYGINAFTNVIIPEGVETISSYAFSGCSNLEKITLPESLKEISSSFISGTAITSLTVPKNVNQSVSIGVTYGAENLKEVIFEEGMERIPGSFCSNTSSLVRVDIPESVTEIGSSAFHRNPQTCSQHKTDRENITSSGEKVRFCKCTDRLHR